MVVVVVTGVWGPFPGDIGGRSLGEGEEQMKKRPGHLQRGGRWPHTLPRPIPPRDLGHQLGPRAKPGFPEWSFGQRSPGRVRRRGEGVRRSPGSQTWAKGMVVVVV